MAPQILVRGEGQEEPLIVPLVATSAYAHGVVDEEGSILDTSDPMDVKTLATVQAFKEDLATYAGCRVDVLGWVLKGGKIINHTTDFGELRDDRTGFGPVHVDEIQRTVAESWGWNENRIRIQHPSGDLVQEGQTVGFSTTLIATRCPWQINSAIIMPQAGSSRSVRSEEETEETSDDKRVDLVTQMSPGHATVANLKRRLSVQCRMNMACFAVCGLHTEDAESLMEPSGLSSSSSASATTQPLRLEDELESLEVSSVVLRLRPQAFRLLVELRNREALWRAGMAGDSRKGILPLARLEADSREMTIPMAQELFNHPCLLEVGDLRLQMIERPEGELLRVAATFRGPRGSLYEGGQFDLELTMPAEWPTRPPTCRFITPIYHVNIGEDGDVPVGSLESIEDDWKQSFTVFDYLGALVERLIAPDPYSAVVPRPNVAKQFRFDPEGYQLKVTAMLRDHAIKP